MLLSVALSDKRVAMILHPKKNNEKPVSSAEWKKQLRAISRHHAGQDGFVDYRNALDYESELETLLTENAERLLKCGLTEDAFSLTCAVYEEAVTVEIDDSDGEITMLLSACGEEWEDAFEAADAFQKEKMQEWFLKEWEKADWLGEETLGKFAFYKSSSEEMILKELSTLDRAIEKEKENAHSYRHTRLM